MQDSNIMETAIQPFVKLAQSNFELIKQLSQLPEMAPPQASEGQNPFLQGPASAAQLLQSGAFVQLMQGAVKNYTEFMMALSQNGMAAVSQTQANLVREGQSMADKAADSASRHHRRVPQEA